VSGAREVLARPQEENVARDLGSDALETDAGAWKPSKTNPIPVSPQATQPLPEQSRLPEPPLDERAFLGFRHRQPELRPPMQACTSGLARSCKSMSETRRRAVSVSYLTPEVAEARDPRPS